MSNGEGAVLFFNGIIIGCSAGMVLLTFLIENWGWKRTKEEHNQWEREKLKARLAGLDKSAPEEKK